MSSKANVIRKSDVGIQSVSQTDIAVDKRRQTISEPIMKENASLTKSKNNSVETKRSISNMSSPFKHHNVPVALGSATSYYFKGAPQTPVQKMIRSQQQQHLLQASMQVVDDEDNTSTNFLINQSYLSSSSSSGGRNSSQDDDALNISVRSDTTELTASNFVALAATHRTTAEDIRNIAENRRLSLSSPTVNNENEKEYKQRRQTMSEVTSNLIRDVESIPRRRETISVPTVPRPSISPAPIAHVVQTMKQQQQLQQRGKNKVAEFIRRQSDGSTNTNRGNGPSTLQQRRRSSIAPTGAIHNNDENLTELLILNSSVHDDEKVKAMNIYDSDTVDLLNHATSTVQNEGSILISSECTTDKKPEVANVNGANESSKDEMLSPIPQNKIKQDSKAIDYTSPARNTRSATKKQASEEKVIVPRPTSEGRSLFQSPQRGTRRTPTKSPQRKKDDSIITDIQFNLSPAKNTRSAMKKYLQANHDKDSDSTLLSSEYNSDNTSNIRDLLASVPNESSRIDKNQDDSTATLGNLLDDVIHSQSTDEVADNISKSTSPLRGIESSPARNTRSAQKARLLSLDKSAVSSKMEDDDTAQLLLSFASGKAQRSFDDVVTDQGMMDSLSSAITANVDNTTASVGGLLNFGLGTTTNSLSSETEMETSQSSTISLNDVLRDYLPKASQDGNLQFELDQSKQSDDLISTNTYLLQSAISKASTIDTPNDMAKTIHENPGEMASPHSPPSTIRFPKLDDLSMKKTISFVPSPMRKSLTPTKLAPSPRRFIHSVDKMISPFKKSLTPSRLPASPYRLQNTNGSVHSSSKLRTSNTPSKLQSSPVRPKRTIGNDENEIPLKSSAFKRQKTFEDLQNRVKGSSRIGDSVSRNQNLPSALRTKGQSLVTSGNKRVGFRSPTFAEYNINSSADTLTPLIKKRTNFSDSIAEDTVEIEKDMLSLLNSTNGGKHENAGSTPFASRHMAQSTIIDDSYMSVDDNVGDAEPTMTLETDMLALLQNAPQDCISIKEIVMEEENTIELETDINALLNISPLDADNPNIESRSLEFDSEPTIELEANMDDLFNDSERVKMEQNPIVSRRFSIAQARRLSVSADGSFNHDAMEYDDSVQYDQNTMSLDVNQKETVFDLKVNEILDSQFRDIIQTQPTTTDFLCKIANVMCENGMSETMNAFLNQVNQTIVSQTSPELDFDATIELSQDNTQRGLALQQYVRSTQGGKVVSEIQSLTSQIQDAENTDWQMWVVAATEQLYRPIDEKLDEINNEINRLDQLCFETEQMLTLVSKKNIKKSRQANKEARLMDIKSLQLEIENLESETKRYEAHRATSEIEANLYEKTVRAIQECQVLSSKLHDEEHVATTYERKCYMLKEAVKFKPMVLKDTNFSFLYDGASPKSCVELSFKLSTTAPPECFARINSNMFRQTNLVETKLFSTVSSFLQSRVTEFCDVTTGHKLDFPSDIAPFLRRAEMMVGRIENTAMEVATLKDRYRNMVSLTKLSDTPSFELNVQYKNLLGVTVLGASFEITEAYPFSPLNVSLNSFDEKVDIEMLHNILVKNAKPGFGYLSRICDILAAAIKV